MFRKRETIEIPKNIVENPNRLGDPKFSRAFVTVRPRGLFGLSTPLFLHGGQPVEEDDKVFASSKRVVSNTIPSVMYVECPHNKADKTIRFEHLDFDQRGKPNRHLEMIPVKKVEVIVGR